MKNFSFHFFNQRVVSLFEVFFRTESTGGYLLILATIFSFMVTNSSWGDGWILIWENHLGNENIRHWINDGLMTFFFLLIGLEIEREIYKGELSEIRNALLPILAALGGMLFPLLIYLIFNHHTSYVKGFGIPMATDIAFSLAILSFLGRRVPFSFKLFLASLAIVNDLTAMLLIALLYSKKIHLTYLLLSFGILLFLFILNLVKVKNLIPYVVGGVLAWFFMHDSGIHPTLTGIILAFAVPYSHNDKTSPSFLLQRLLHVPVAYFILPVFALANAAVVLNLTSAELYLLPVLGSFLGLFFGKPLGITLFSFLAIKLNIVNKPADFSFFSLVGIGFLGGIGFTMSFFFTYLSFEDVMLTNVIKMSVLLSSILSALVGMAFLSYSIKRLPMTE